MVAIVSINEEIISMLEAVKCIPVPITENTNLFLDLGIDSLSFVKFLVRLEERYTISFDIAEMNQCLRLGRMVELTKSKVKGCCQIND